VGDPDYKKQSYIFNNGPINIDAWEKRVQGRIWLSVQQIISYINKNFDWLFVPIAQVIKPKV